MPLDHELAGMLAEHLGRSSSFEVEMHPKVAKKIGLGPIKSRASQSARGAKVKGASKKQKRALEMAKKRRKAKKSRKAA